MDNLSCLECDQVAKGMLVFVDRMKQDGKFVNLDDGYHPYCSKCREKLGISDELNPGRDLRAECKEMVLTTIEETNNKDRREVCDLIMDRVDQWIGVTDRLFQMMGKVVPNRPNEVFNGFNDALNELDPSKMSIMQSLMLIQTSYSVKDRILNWDDFVNRTHEHYKNVAPDRADKILSGFIK